MVLNTLTVSGAVTPAVIQTFFSHYLNRTSRKRKPTAHISYDEGIHLIRSFLLYASHHTVEDIQRFTSQWVPHPHWVKVDEAKIGATFIQSAAETLQAQLGEHGIQKVGGKTWWQWRRPGSHLAAEWIEMRSDHHARKKSGDRGKRVMLYVHGGAYFFGSVDEHRYQMQRHARKLKARVFARIRTRLFWLEILLVEDMLVVLRDQGLPLPAGAVLISPWVDLTHSFPSVAAENPLDYIPPYGFHQRPSPSWPPPNADDMLAITQGLVSNVSKQKNPTGEILLPEAIERNAAQGFHVEQNPPSNMVNSNANTVEGAGIRPRANTVPGSSRNLSIMIDGELVEIKDQIQMYATNDLVSHPLVSPVLQPSLGGLPPLLILTGGGEMLRDEQIYVAHKAANPGKYIPGEAFLNEHDKEQVHRYKPTDVQLQVFDDLCHVAPTLSFTRPAKYMYRSIAQFGAWALARAQKTSIDILDDDDVSVISGSSTSSETIPQTSKHADSMQSARGQIGKAGESLPPFRNHMIRQRVDRHGVTYPLEPEEELPSCTTPIQDIGVIKEGPVKKWMMAKRKWDVKYASSKRKVQKIRIKEMAKGYQSFGDGEIPPPSALAGRIRAGVVENEQKRTKSLGMMFWARIGSSHDRDTKEREEKADKFPEYVYLSKTDGTGRSSAEGKTEKEKVQSPRSRLSRFNASRSRSRRRAVRDERQTGEYATSSAIPINLHTVDPSEDTETGRNIASNPPTGPLLSPSYASAPRTPSAESGPTEKSLASASLQDDADASEGVRGDIPIEERLEDDRRRPKLDGIAFPFTLKVKGAEGDGNESMLTLTSSVGVKPMGVVAGREGDGAESTLTSTGSAGVELVGKNE